MSTYLVVAQVSFQRLRRRVIESRSGDIRCAVGSRSSGDGFAEANDRERAILYRSKPLQDVFDTLRVYHVAYVLYEMLVTLKRRILDVCLHAGQSKSNLILSEILFLAASCNNAGAMR